MASKKGKLVIKNTVFLYIRMLILMAITLYTSRVVLKNLGIEDYGVYNVISGFITMFSLFKFSFATQRFVSYSLGKNDIHGVHDLIANFNALNIIIRAIFIIIAESVGLWYIENKLVIPEGQLNVALWVYQAAILSFIILLYGGTYQAVIIAHERMDVFAYISIVEGIIKLSIAFTISLDIDNKLKIYAIFMALSQLICQGIYAVYSQQKLKIPIFNIQLKWDIVKSILGFSGWMSLTGVFVMLSTQGINMLLNFFGGPILNAARGISIQIQTAIQSFGQNFMQAINPQIVKSWAENDIDYTKTLFLIGSKMGFLLMFCISLPIFLETESVMLLWLGRIVPYSIIFLRIILIWSLVSILSYPCMMLKQATGEIKSYQLLEIIFLSLVFVISWISLYNGAVPQSVFYITLIGEILLLSCRLIMVLPIIKIKKIYYLKEIILRLAVVVFFTTISIYFISDNLLVHPFVKLIIVTISTFSMSVLMTFLVGCNKIEKRILISYFQKITSRWKK